MGRPIPDIYVGGFWWRGSGTRSVRGVHACGGQRRGGGTAFLGSLQRLLLEFRAVLVPGLDVTSG
jgi:hypothetical protein